jgi:hypothetical protein
VARSPSSRDALARLRAGHTRLERVLKRKIVERTTEADATRLVKECQAAIAAGNRDFMIVYDGVWKVIASGEPASVEAYKKAVAELGEACVGEARQRDERTFTL